MASGRECVTMIDDGALAASRRVSELVCCGRHVRKEQVVKLRDLEGRRVSVFGRSYIAVTVTSS